MSPACSSSARLPMQAEMILCRLSSRQPLMRFAHRRRTKKNRKAIFHPCTFAAKKPGVSVDAPRPLVPLQEPSWRYGCFFLERCCFVLSLFALRFFSRIILDNYFTRTSFTTWLQQRNVAWPPSYNLCTPFWIFSFSQTTEEKLHRPQQNSRTRPNEIEERTPDTAR